MKLKNCDSKLAQTLSPVSPLTEASTQGRGENKPAVIMQNKSGTWQLYINIPLQTCHS